jgi:hypothetical protein
MDPQPVGGSDLTVEPLLVLGAVLIDVGSDQ